MKLRRTGLEILEVSMRTIGTRSRAAFVSVNFYKKSKYMTFVNFLFFLLLTSLFSTILFFIFLIFVKKKVVPGLTSSCTELNENDKTKSWIFPFYLFNFYDFYFYFAGY